MQAVRKNMKPDTRQYYLHLSDAECFGFGGEGWCNVALLRFIGSRKEGSNQQVLAVTAFCKVFGLPIFIGCLSNQEVACELFACADRLDVARLSCASSERSGRRAASYLCSCLHLHFLDWCSSRNHELESSFQPTAGRACAMIEPFAADPSNP